MRTKYKGALGALIVVLALSGLTATSALASGPPIVETKPATLIGGAEANLNGVVSNNGASTKYYFEYGPTTAYGSKTKESTVLGKLEPHAAVQGLSTLTTYHFRVVATNSFGTSYGTDEKFTTITEKPEFSVNAGQKLTELLYGNIAGRAVWASKNSWSITCEKLEMKGRAANSKTLNGKFYFIGCNSGSATCKGPTGKEGEIATEELQGTLVYISKTAKTVGLVFKPQTAAYLAKFRCEGTVYRELRGSIIVPVGPPNLKRLGFEEEKLGLNGEGAQLITEYENGRGEKVHTGLEANWPSTEWAPLGWSIGEFFVDTSKEVEIQA